MLLEKEALAKHRPEIDSLYKEYLGEESKGHTLFGLFGEDGELMAVASVKNIGANYRLRGCVVKPEHQGKGYQQVLIKERVEYLQSKGITKVRVCVFPDNKYSIANIEDAGFQFIGMTEVEEKEANLYEMVISDAL
jgi:RimJ/RimL family protein N-acetyltransferase